jgi:hypothetical protein
VHVVGGLDRPNTMFVEDLVTEHALGTRQQNIDGSEEARALFFLRDPNAALVALSEPWLSALKHVQGVSVLEDAHAGLLRETATDGLAVLCDELRPGSPERELHKKVLRVVMQEARWLKDPANKAQIITWIEANIQQRNMLEKVEANRGNRELVWKTADHLHELSEEIYDATVPLIADRLPSDALARVRNTIRLVLGKSAPADISGFADFSLAQEVQDELDREQKKP